jgi:RimJ/RimL family protein N-acetyltransferase
MADELLTDGVIRLRAWALDDAGWYAATVRDPEIQQFTMELPDVTEESVRASIRQLHAGGPPAAGYLVTDALTGERLGSIALTARGAVGDVSGWLAPAARGRGIATRALRAFSAWVFACLDVQELRLYIRTENAASQAVALRAGYHRDPAHDGTWEVKGEPWPTTTFALTPPDPDPQRGPGQAPAPGPTPAQRRGGSDHGGYQA